LTQNWSIHMISRRHIVLALGVFVATSAAAHDPKGARSASPHGGQVVDVEGGHLEFLATPGEIVVYVTGPNDETLASAGMTGRAIVQDGGKLQELPLVAKPPNMLAAALVAPLPKGAKVAISATLANAGKPVQARFVVK
jgi:hypothetical protein